MNTTATNIQSEAFSSIDLVHQCLIDPDKAAAFTAVLEKVIHKDSTVLEFGTGSGILSLIAAKAGAKSIMAIEFDTYIANVARGNIQRNRQKDIITVITEDARTVIFPPGTQFDVVIMEMINTGLVEEMQVQAINNLCSQNLILPTTIVIPAIQESYVTLANTDFIIHGFNMKMVKQIWTIMESDTVLLSKKILLNRIDFSSPVPELYSREIEIEIQQSGTINCIVLSGRTILNREETIILEQTWSLNPDVIVPLPEREVVAGDAILLSIEYIFGGGFGHFHAEIVQ